MGLGSGSALADIVHDDLLVDLAGFYPATVTIQQATITRRGNGEQVLTWGTFLSGLRGNMARTKESENRVNSLTIIPQEWALNLTGYYPTITVEHRALIGVVAYNITGVTHDSLSESTRLVLERVTH
jgi:hypothetical protein